MPPCTSTRESCKAWRDEVGMRSRPRMVWRGRRVPRLTPNSASVGVAGAPSISLIPGQSPPESCQPPPEPPIHSPRMVRAATMRRSVSVIGPVRDLICPVARMQAAIKAPSKWVETARREPLGIPLTFYTSSPPQPGPKTRPSRSARLAPERSMPGGMMPAAMMAALRRPR